MPEWQCFIFIIEITSQIPIKEYLDSTFFSCFPEIRNFVEQVLSESIQTIGNKDQLGHSSETQHK